MERKALTAGTAEIGSVGQPRQIAPHPSTQTTIETPERRPEPPVAPPPGARPPEPGRRPGPGKRRRRPSSRWVWLSAFPLAAALALGVAVRLVDIAAKHVLQPDEAVSYMAATGHEQAYGRAVAGGLAGHWATAGAWKALLRPDGFWGFTRIRVGLNVADNHPPLYFWALHLWVWRLGVHLWSGPLLNTVVVVGTALALFVLTRRVLHDDLQASLVVALWIVSHPVVTVTLWARQYDQLALCGVLLALALHRLVEPKREPRPRDAVWLALAVAAALLTQYEASLFVLIALGGSAVVLLVARRARRLWHLLIGAGLGVALFVALDPGFLHSFMRQRAQSSPLHAAAVLARLGNVVSSLESFYVWNRQVPLGNGHLAYERGRPEALAIVLILAVMAALLSAVPPVRRAVLAWLRRRSAGDWQIAATAGGAAAATIGGYLLLQVPVYAMGTRYIALLWPFLALGTVCVLRLLPRTSLLAVVLIVPFVVVPMTVHGILSARDAPLPAALPTPLPALVVDDCSRLVLPRLLWSVPDDTPVFASDQASLLRDSDPWLARLRPGDIVVSMHGATTAESQPLTALLSRRFSFVPDPWPSLETAQGYLIRGRQG